MTMSRTEKERERWEMCMLMLIRTDTETERERWRETHFRLHVPVEDGFAYGVSGLAGGGVEGCSQW